VIDIHSHSVLVLVEEEEDFDILVVPVWVVVVGESHIAVVPGTTVVTAVDTHKYNPMVVRRGTHTVSSKEFWRPQ
jgi:hypothetical protein